MSRDWSGYTGEDKAYKSVKSGKQYVSEKTITDVWRYLHKDNYVLGDFVFSKYMRELIPVYVSYWSDNYSYQNGEYRIYSPYVLIYSSDDPNFMNAGWSGTIKYDTQDKTVYYSSWYNYQSGGYIRLTAGEPEPILNPYNSLPENLKTNPALAAWKMTYESTPGSDMTDEQIINLLKSTTSIWNDHVIIGGKDYPYLPPLQ